MIGISKIRLKRHEDSRLLLGNLKLIIEEQLKVVASSTKFRVWEYEEEIDVSLEKPISLQTVNKIMHTFQVKRIRIKEFTWKEYKEGPVRRGTMNIIVS